jgi:hypothetical protein
MGIEELTKRIDKCIVLLRPETTLDELKNESINHAEVTKDLISYVQTIDNRLIVLEAKDDNQQ